MTPNELRSKRIAAEIPATVLALTAKINRSRLSNIERGYVEPTTSELCRLTRALEELINAKTVIDKVTASVGWPVGRRS